MTKGACMAKECAWQRRRWQRGACVAGETATAADGTHPAGMHSCSFCWLVRVSLFIELGCPGDLGKGWRVDLGTFMIS